MIRKIRVKVHEEISRQHKRGLNTFLNLQIEENIVNGMLRPKWVFLKGTG